MQPPRPLLLAALVFIAPLLAYANSVGNGFAFDDVYVVEKNPYVRDVRNIPGYFLSSARQASHDMKTYRPLRQAMFTLEYRLFGLNPAGYHAINVLNHAANCVLLFFFFRRLGLGGRGSALASLLFAVHPVNTEAVANITGRADTMFFFFYIAGLALYLKAEDGAGNRRLFLAGSLAACALSLLSKEMAVTFPLAVLLLDLLRRKGEAGRKAPFYLALLAVCAGYLALRWRALGGMGGGEYYGDSLLTTMLSQSGVFLRYIGLVFVPWPLSARYDITLREDFLDPCVLSFLLLAALLAAAAMRAAFRKELPLWLFGSLWFFVALLPVSNIVPIRAAMMGERYLYLPLAGAMVAVFSTGGGLCARSRPVCRGVAVLWLLAFAAFFSLTVARNPVWKDNLTLFEDTRTKAPDSLVVHWTLFEEYTRRGEADKAQREFAEMKRINTLAALRHLAVAEKYLAEGRLADAERMARKALMTKPDLAAARQLIERLGGGREAGR